jgi:pimeloyl-ACP methyl ester carboxylesterase
MTRRALTQGDVELSYYETGRGAPVVLVHGYPLDHTMWRPQIAALRDTCRVIAPDLRGFGRSTLAEGDAENGVEMARYAADVGAVLDATGVREPAILCGFSLGGYVLWQFVRLFPERVRAIVLCDTKAVADGDEARAARLKVAAEVIRTGAGPIAESMLPKLLAPATLANRLDVVEAVDAVIRRTSPAAIAAAQRGMAGRPDVRGDLPGLNFPALVIVGANDAISPPAEMREIAQALPNAKIVEIPDAGHMTTLENPAAVNEALRKFIAGLSPRQANSGEPAR